MKNSKLKKVANLGSQNPADHRDLTLDRKFAIKPLVAAIFCTTGALSIPAAAQIEEIIVTATRRAQLIQDVPYNISAVSAETLEDAGIIGLGDIARFVPGIAFVDQGPVSRGNNNNFVLRGLNASAAINNRSSGSASVAAVSTYLGETPMFFTMTMKDLERVEVLRGPQGTLYGSGAVGGTIRFIPKNPDLQGGFSVDLDANVSATEDSDEPNYATDVIVNLPVNDHLGLRLAGGYEQQGGFIDGLGIVRKDPATRAATPVPSDDLFGGYDLLDRQEDINDSESWWVRATALWDVNDNIQAVVRYQHEESDQDNQQWSSGGFAGGLIDSSAALVSGNINANVGGCPHAPGEQVNTFVQYEVPCLAANGSTAYPNGSTLYPAVGNNEHILPLEEPFEEQLDLVALEINADLGFATLTSATSYWKTQEKYERETTGFLESVLVPGASNLAAAYAFFPRLTIIDFHDNDTDAFTQEIRLASNWDKRWDYVVGFYYHDEERVTDEESPWPGISEFCLVAGIATPVGAATPGAGCFDYPGAANANPQLGDITFTKDAVEEFEDIAVFGELTYHVTDEWQVTGGFRWFDQEFIINNVQTFPFCGIYCGADSLGTNDNGESKQTSNETIFRVNTSYDISDDMMVYFTWAEGFRRGGSNPAPTGGPQASSITLYAPDEAENFEVGIKGVWDGSIQYSLSAYRVDWEGFQTNFFTAFGFGSTTNGGKARSQGIEFELHGQVNEQFSFDLGYSYTDAEVRENVEIIDLIGSGPGVLRTIDDGSPLPSVPENSVTLNADYEHTAFTSILPGSTLHWNVNGSFRDDAQSDFDPVTVASFDMDSFWIWNASVKLQTEGNWSANLFVRNLFNEEGVTGGLSSAFATDKSSGFFVSRPRTVGLGISYSFN